MQTPAAILTGAFQGRSCRVTKRECDWRFDFGDRISISSPGPWRVVTAHGIAHADTDDGHKFGHPAPVNGEARTNILLQGQKVIGLELDEQIADLRVMFDGGARLDLLNNSSGYEGWQACIGGQDGITLIALGGGKLYIH